MLTVSRSELCSSSDIILISCSSVTLPLCCCTLSCPSFSGMVSGEVVVHRVLPWGQSRQLPCPGSSLKPSYLAFILAQLIFNLFNPLIFSPTSILIKLLSKPSILSTFEIVLSSQAAFDKVLSFNPTSVPLKFPFLALFLPSQPCPQIPSPLTSHCLCGHYECLQSWKLHFMQVILDPLKILYNQIIHCMKLLFMVFLMVLHLCL